VKRISIALCLVLLYFSCAAFADDTDLDKNKVIVTACPHKDRATIAMVYLKTKGYNAKYLEDGLVGLAEALRGDAAREFVK